MIRHTGLRAVAAAGLLDHVRYEVIPTGPAFELVTGNVPNEVTVTVTASPSRGLEPTVELAERLAAHGYRVVPHLSARLVEGEDHLRRTVDRLLAAGVDNVFVPAGDADPPAGPFESSLDVLARLDALGRPFAHVGITGYPETHPIIGDDVTIQSMWDKRRYADYIVSNLCFDPATIRQWLSRVRSRGVTLPIWLGLAGPIDRTRLVAMATKIGVRESARFASTHAGSFARLGTPGVYSPERLLDRTGTALADPSSLVHGLHLFTFNQVAETERWRRQLIERFGAAHAATPS